MPKRTDINKILIIGAGPIIIGQACEFDYSGSQACKALMEEGFEVILVNSNPATIMTDPQMATATYIEPITAEVIEKIIEKEKPDAILPTLGGQTALNVSVELAEKGILEKHKVEMIGANLAAIQKAEDRDLFKKAMQNIQLDLPKSTIVRTMDEALEAIKEIGYPCIIRPAFTLGGTGGSIAINHEEFIAKAKWGLDISPITEILIEESVLGWKEFELEVMRDHHDNVVIICSIENFDPMGVHTGDSITVAPIQTLSDKEYQILRDYSIQVIREIGVDTGGSNIQFAVNPDTGRVVIIEMNPRVSRSSALASKATGFPIAKIAAKLAVGYTLDEIPNDITKETPASFEPTLDYCVVKIPRWGFEKFPHASKILGIQMKSVGEVMAIGRTFKEALQKGLRSLEIGKHGLENHLLIKDNIAKWKNSDYHQDQVWREQFIEEIKTGIRQPTSNRIFYIKDALDVGMPLDDIFELSCIDRWFLHNIKEINDFEKQLIKPLQEYDQDLMLQSKQMGFSDFQIARYTQTSEIEVRNHRKSLEILPTYKLVDTCAAEFEAKTPYYYSTYEEEDEAFPDNKQKIMILGGGPNRIGQGIEFDYMCVHASFALKEAGFETIMVNSNPETVSTDYDTSDKLYFEPLTLEDVLNIYEKEKPIGVIVQLGGQTPLNLAQGLEENGVNILGTSCSSIDEAEDRDRFKAILHKNGFLQPDNDTAINNEGAKVIAKRIGYPVVVRPSYVLGGRAMEIVYNDQELENYMRHAIDASREKPILIDKFLENAIEIDVDSICDGEEVIVIGIMEHIEEAGIHSGDSACVLPPFTLSQSLIDELIAQTKRMAFALSVKGLMNIQFALKEDKIYFLEVNPRGSRTVPFVSKSSGIPWSKLAARVMAGEKLKNLPIDKAIQGFYTVKEVVLPFNKFPEEDTILGPEMKSTGEVMGIDKDYSLAYYKAQIAAGTQLPMEGSVFVSVNSRNRNVAFKEAMQLMHKMGFNIIATRGTKLYLEEAGIQADLVYKVNEGKPDIADLILEEKIDLIFNTPLGAKSRYDETIIRQMAIRYLIPAATTVPGILAMCKAIYTLKEHKNIIEVFSLQELIKNYTHS